MATQKDAVELSQHWIEAWNSRDLESVLSHYHPEVLFQSPRVAAAFERTGGQVSSGPVARPDCCCNPQARPPHTAKSVSKHVGAVRRRYYRVAHANPPNELMRRTCKYGTEPLLDTPRGLLLPASSTAGRVPGRYVDGHGCATAILPTRWERIVYGG